MCTRYVTTPSVFATVLSCKRLIMFRAEYALPDRYPSVVVRSIVPGVPWLQSRSLMLPRIPLESYVVSTSDWVVPSSRITVLLAGVLLEAHEVLMVRMGVPEAEP